MLIMTEIRKCAPSVFAERPDSKVSKDKYSFIPTSEIIDHLDHLGWGVHSAVQQRVRKESKKDTTKHMLKFRMHGWDADELTIGEEIPEILLVNSHDRTSSFKFHIGIHRVVCSNGMVVACQALRDLKLRHMNHDFEGVKQLVIRMTDELPGILNQIDCFKQIYMSRENQINFAYKALAARYPEYQDIIGNPLIETIGIDVDMDDFITHLREKDKEPTLWNILNITQEKLTKGGFYKSSEKSRALAQKRLERGEKNAVQIRAVRPISNIGKYVDMNKDLWQVAEDFAAM
jgi:hypothetical protein